MCNGCWAKIDSFHEFYQTVETNYKNQSDSWDNTEIESFRVNIKCEPDTLAFNAEAEAEPFPNIDESIDTKEHLFETIDPVDSSHWDDNDDSSENEQDNDEPDDFEQNMLDDGNVFAEAINDVKMEDEPFLPVKEKKKRKKRQEKEREEGEFM